MRLYAKVCLMTFGTIVLAAVLLFAGGCLSAPRDFSSPSATIRVVGDGSIPLTGLEVGRNWYDSDVGSDGTDTAVENPNGGYSLPKIPASVGVFTGAWRKTYSHLGMCGRGSGTYTQIHVRFRGQYDVLPQGKSLHAVGQHGAHQDSDGVWFASRLDSQSNTLVSLTFPPKTKNIDYVLAARPQAR
jgi:hypothetical protein